MKAHFYSFIEKKSLLQVKALIIYLQGGDMIQFCEQCDFNSNS